MEVEAPPRAQWIRTILFELSRIANVSLFLGDMGVQLGALTPVFYAFRDREYVLNLIEAATGGRFHPNFDRIGGLKDDLPKGWIDETKAVMKKMRRLLRRDGDAARSATRSSRPAPAASASSRAEVALSYGLSGANLRGSAASTGTSAATSRCRWPGTRSTGRSGPTPTATLRPRTGSASRRCARPPRSSTSCSTACPAGRSWPRCPASSRCPRARPGCRTENPLGEMGYYVVSQGRPRAVPGQDPLGQLQQHLDRAVGAAGRLRPRRHHHPGQPLLHPRGHRPVTARAAIGRRRP